MAYEESPLARKGSRLSNILREVEMNEFLKFCEWRTADGYERAIGQAGDSRAPISEIGWPLNFVDFTPSFEESQTPLRPMGRDQIWMLPPTLDELIPADHPARFADAYPDGLGRAWGRCRRGPFGSAGLSPRALLSVRLYGLHDRRAPDPQA